MEPSENPDPHPPADLLESTHEFPCTYTIKAIGDSADDFEARILSAAGKNLASSSDLEYSTRATKGGRHLSITLRLVVQNAEQVRTIYAEIRQVEGLTLLL